MGKLRHKQLRAILLGHEEVGLKPRRSGSGAYGLNHQAPWHLCSLSTGLAHSRCSVNENIPQVCVMACAGTQVHLARVGPVVILGGW